MSVMKDNVTLAGDPGACFIAFVSASCTIRTIASSMPADRCCGSPLRATSIIIPAFLH